LRSSFVVPSSSVHMIAKAYPTLQRIKMLVLIDVID
jgi:hypothetical protein